jgi:hypothetical protein
LSFRTSATVSGFIVNTAPERSALGIAWIMSMNLSPGADAAARNAPDAPLTIWRILR